MSEKFSTDDKSTNEALGVSRRRLMRAGLSAAPVVLALKSNSVLAAGSSSGGFCVKPSTFASLGAAAIKSPNASQAPRISGGYKCLSHGYWKTHNTGLIPGNFKTTTKFLSTLNEPSPTGFTSNPGFLFTNKTIQEVLSNGGGGAESLARHLAAAYLTARVYPNEAVLSAADCANIWNSPGNTWSPVAGDTSWNTNRWIAYFDFILG